MTDSSSFDHNLILPGPSFHVDLAPLDGRHPEHYSCRLLVFRCDDSEQRHAQLSAFKTGLQALVLHCPIVGGKVVPLPPETVNSGKSNWYTIVSGQGIELIVKDLRGKVVSFKELEAANFSSLQLLEDFLMPIPPSFDFESPYPACKVQYSAIDGGTIISFAISHHLTDGSGTNELMRMLSEDTRLAQEIPQKAGSIDCLAANIKGVGLDRSLLRNITSDEVFKIENHPAYTLKSMTPVNAESVEQDSKHPFEVTSPEIPVLVRISPAGLALLKADATMSGAPSISTHDALSALIWRTVMLIRSRRSALGTDIPSSTRSKIFMPSDARRHLGLPPSYIGNAVYQLTAELDIGTLLSESGLQYAASSLRRAITAVNSSIVTSYMAKLKETWIDWGFMSGTSTIAVAMGTDWTSRSLYTDDWGKAFGPVIKYRYPGAVGEAFNCIYPRLPNGEAEVMIGVMSEEIGTLKGSEGFGKYLNVA